MPGSADNPNVYADHPSNGNTLHWQTVIQPFFKGLIVIINLPTREETGERQTVYPAGLVNHFKTSWPFIAPIVGNINGSILYNADKSSRVCTFSSPKSSPVLLRKMLILLSFLISSVAAADLVTTNITYALGAPFSYGPTVLPAQTAMVFNFTYSSCMGRVLINATGMVPDDMIIIESVSTQDVYQQTMGKLAQHYIDTRNSPPYICATFKATMGSEMNFTLHAEKTCSTGGKGDNSDPKDPKSSLNLSILGSISCFLLYLLVK